MNAPPYCNMFHGVKPQFEFVKMSATISSFEDVRSREEYRASPSRMPASGLLTPPILYNLDTRRDSVASAHTSMSFGSCMSDYSMPVTPTHGESPVPGRHVAEVMPYELGQDLHDQPYPSLPMESKTFPGPDDHLYGSWALSTPDTSMSLQNANQSTQVSGCFFETHASPQLNFEMPITSSASSSWEGWSTAVDAGSSRHWSNHASTFGMPEGGAQPFWSEQVQMEQPPHMMMLPPSGGMADAEDEYADVEPAASVANTENSFVMVAPPYFSDSESFEDIGRPFAQSPQEVFFKKENSPPSARPDSDIEEHVERPLRSIHMTSTGGKTVKKEQRSYSDLTRRKSHRKSRHAKGARVGPDDELFLCLPDGTRTILVQDGVQCEYDGKSINYTPRGIKKEKHPCVFCPKSFARQEHLQRHIRTHDGKKDHGCPLPHCGKAFNRNDNLVAHFATHVEKPGRKPGRNKKWLLEEVQAHFEDQKMKDKIRHMYMKDMEKDQEKR
ncbi:hypothetical protein PMIN06_004458 [Paraphaeosphaeria minitans]